MWTQTVPGTGPVPLEVEQHYTLDALAGDAAQIGFAFMFRLAPDAPPMGVGPMAFRMQMDGTGTGTWHLNLRDGTSMPPCAPTSQGGGTPVEATPGMPSMQMQMQQDSRSWTIITRAEG